MGNVFNAHIFGRSRRGDREEVKLKLFNSDGTPFEGGGAPAEPVSPWKTAIQIPQFILPSDTSALFGPELDFTVGDSMMAHIYASGIFWISAGQTNFSLILDDEVIADGSSSNSNPNHFSLYAPTAGGNLRATFVANGKIPAFLPAWSYMGLIMDLASGDHKLQFGGGNTSDGGKVKELRLAVMPF